MIIIVVYVLFCSTIILSTGILISELCKKYTGYEVKSFDEAVLCGVIGLSIITGYASLILAINSIFLLFIIAIVLCFTLFYKERKMFNSMLFKGFNYKSEILFFSLTLLFLSIVASKEIHTFDSGLYHTQSIRWIRSFSVVPGLANLQPQFGFNSMFFPISALFTLDVPNFMNGKDLLVYPLNIIIFLAISTRLFSTTISKFKSSDFIDGIFYISILSLIFLLLPKHISSPSPDISCALLIIYSFYLVLEFRVFKNRYLLYVLVLLTTILVTYKLSTIIIGLLSLAILCKQKSGISLYKTAGIALVAILPYIIRNYYLSGYVIFPFSGIDIFSTDWKVPIESVTFEAGVIKAWARIPGSLKSLNMPFGEWLSIWWNHQDLIDKGLILSNVLLPVVLIYNLVKRNWRISLVSFVIIANFYFWFFTAPDVRFAYGFLVTGLALIFRCFMRVVADNKWLYKISIFITVVSLALILFFYRNSLIPNQQLLSNVIMPYSYPEPEVKSVSIDFDYFKTINGSRCFNHDLPCNTRVTSRSYDIFLRSEELSSGFRVVEK